MTALLSAHGIIGRANFRGSSSVSRYQSSSSRFTTTAGLSRSFDWGKWQEAAQEYVEQPRKIETANITVIQKLLTTHVRKERFCEGHLAEMFENGHVLGLLRRLNLRDGTTLKLT